MARHRLKTWPDPFTAIWDGRKTAEFRKNDRNFGEGDLLELAEYTPPEQGYNGPYGFTQAEVMVLVTDIRTGGLFGIPEGYCMLSFCVLYRTTHQGEILLPSPPGTSKRPREVFRHIAREILGRAEGRES